MNTTYTAGPWRVENESAAENPDPGDSDIWIGTEGGGHSIAHIGRDPGLTHDQHMANARLISKAPEMRALLELAHAVLRDCSDEAGDTSRWNEGGDGYEVTTQIRALLAALDGEVRS